MKELLDKILAKKWEDMSDLEKAIALASSIDEDVAERAADQLDTLNAYHTIFGFGNV